MPAVFFVKKIKKTFKKNIILHINSGILYTKQKINTKKERKNSYDAKRKNNTGTY